MRQVGLPFQRPPQLPLPVGWEALVPWPRLLHLGWLPVPLQRKRFPPRWKSWFPPGRSFLHRWQSFPLRQGRRCLPGVPGRWRPGALRRREVPADCPCPLGPCPLGPCPLGGSPGLGPHCPGWRLPWRRTGPSLPQFPGMDPCPIPRSAGPRLRCSWYPWRRCLPRRRPPGWSCPHFVRRRWRGWCPPAGLGRFGPAAGRSPPKPPPPPGIPRWCRTWWDLFPHRGQSAPPPVPGFG